MLASSIPLRFALPFAVDALSANIRTVPVPSQIGITDGAASFHDGFPADCFLPTTGGGVPPFGQDFNGLLNVVTAWEQWLQAGAPIGYNASFSTSIGGYPNGAVLPSTTPGLYWRSTADSNTTDPDGGSPANWVNFFPQSITGNAGTATKLQTARTISLTGAVTGSVAFDGSSNVSLASTLTLPPQNLAAKGHYTFPGGLIEQWGTIAIPSGSNTQTVAETFDIAFPNNCFGVNGNADHNATASSWHPVVVNCILQTQTGFSAVADAANAAVSFQAGISVKYRAWGN